MWKLPRHLHRAGLGVEGQFLATADNRADRGFEDLDLVLAIKAFHLEPARAGARRNGRVTVHWPPKSEPLFEEPSVVAVGAKSKWARCRSITLAALITRFRPDRHKAQSAA